MKGYLDDGCGDICWLRPQMQVQLSADLGIKDLSNDSLIGRSACSKCCMLLSDCRHEH